MILLFKGTDSEGFELSVPFGTAVFKTAALDHSANCPYALGGGRTHKTRILSPIRMPIPSQERMGSEGFEPPILAV